MSDEPPPSTSPVISASSSKLIFAQLGGTVTAGDFTVIIPPDALSRLAIITITQPDVTQPVVELRVGPESANGFKTPVTLVARASRLDPSLLPETYISWYNPVTKQWEPVAGGSVKVADLTVQAPLTHFSTYRVERDGKAGW